MNGSKKSSLSAVFTYINSTYTKVEMDLHAALTSLSHTLYRILSVVNKRKLPKATELVFKIIQDNLISVYKFDTLPISKATRSLFCHTEKFKLS